MIKRFLLLQLLFLAVACTEKPYTPEESYDDDKTTGGGDTQVNTPQSAEADIFDESEYTRTISVVWEGASVKVTPSDILPVKIDGADLVLGDATSSQDGIMVVLSGNSDNGSVKIYNQKKYLMVLDNLNLASASNAPINNQCKKRLFVKLEGKNSISDSGAYSNISEGEDCKAALFSEGQIIVCDSEGSLDVTSEQAHAIASDGYIILNQATMNLKSEAKDGVHANEYILVHGAALSIVSCGEGLDSEGTVSISDGTIEINTTGEKAHAIRALSDITISGGEIVAKTVGNASKCINSDNNILVCGGKLDLQTSGSAIYETAERDVSSSACIRAVNYVELKNAKIACLSTGKGGKGINCYQLTIGESESDTLELSVKTTGTVYKYSNSITSSPKAIRCTDAMNINGGVIDVVASGKADGSEGVESKTDIVINGGQLRVETYDDGLNAGKSLVINGGDIRCYASNNDGIDSNGTITINGGMVYSSGALSPEEGFDCDRNTFSINGGIIMGFGGATSNPTASASKQYSSVLSSVNLPAQTQCTVKNAAGEEVMSFVSPERSYSSCTLLLSHPDFTSSSFTLEYGSRSSSFTPSFGSNSTGGGPGGGGPGGGGPGGGGRPW